MPPFARTQIGAEPYPRAYPTSSDDHNTQPSSEPEPHTMETPSAPAHIEQNVRLVQSIWPHVLKSTKHYISDQDLKALKISVSPLSFTTGQVYDDGQQFIKLLPTDDVDRILKLIRPWDADGVRKTLSYDPSDTDIWRARDMWLFIDTLLYYSPDPRGQRLFDQVKEMSIRLVCELDRLNWSDWETEINWNAEIVIENNNGVVPHRTCYLVDDAPLRKNVLNSSELYCIMSTIAIRSLKKKYKRFQIVPVTLITGSGTRIRITQGYPDGANGQLKVRMSSIVDLVEDPEKQWSHILTILSWLAGSPVGVTE